MTFLLIGSDRLANDSSIQAFGSAQNLSHGVRTQYRSSSLWLHFPFRNVVVVQIGQRLGFQDSPRVWTQPLQFSLESVVLSPCRRVPKLAFEVLKIRAGCSRVRNQVPKLADSWQLLAKHPHFIVNQLAVRQSRTAVQSCTPNSLSTSRRIEVAGDRGGGKGVI